MSRTMYTIEALDRGESRWIRVDREAMPGLGTVREIARTWVAHQPIGTVVRIVPWTRGEEVDLYVQRARRAKGK